LGIFSKLIAQGRVRRAKSLREQKFDCLSNQLSPRIAEKLFGLHRLLGRPTRLAQACLDTEVMDGDAVAA
ncbi:MAG: hypothetical protein WAM17_09450, partial [Rhodoplanes sp.]